jgi:SAM-dependent methyltransferase
MPPRVQRWVLHRLRARSVRAVGLGELDAELSKVAELFSVSEDAARADLDGFCVQLPSPPPADPFSDAYGVWVWDLYRHLSGRREYHVGNEASPFDYERALVRPFPYETASPGVVGGDLVARGHLLRCLGEEGIGLAPPARIVEFGPGWGNLTNDLVATGFSVTAVELDTKFCALIEERCALPSQLTLVQADMLSYATDEPFDAAVFYASFHHCSDHLAMLRKLHDIVRPGGRVFFASEPIQLMDYPWGPRLDGLSVWSTRTYGWLELGFDTAYFAEALARTGWMGERRRLRARADAADVIVAVGDAAR